MDWSKLSYAEIKEALGAAPILAGPWQGSDGSVMVEAEWDRSFLNRQGGAMVFPIGTRFQHRLTAVSDWIWQITLPNSNSIPTEHGYAPTREEGQAAADAALRAHGVRLPEDG